MIGSWGFAGEESEDSKVKFTCIPPSAHLFKQKLKEWYHTEKLERELREVVAYPRNGERREAVRSLHRQSYFADRFREDEIRQRKQAEFEGMAQADPRRSGNMENFPVPGAVSHLQGGETGSLEIFASSIPRTDQTLLSPEMLAKLGNSIRVNFHYPIDRFEYSFVYGGQEYPFEQAIFRMREDYETECVEYAKRQEEFQYRRSQQSGGQGRARSQ